MNKFRRSQIKQAIIKIQSIVDSIQYILDDEQEAYDNMPDSLRESSNGEASMNAQDNIQAAIDAMNEGICYLEEVD